MRLSQVSGLTLLPDVLANAGKREESIAEPAERAVAKFTALVADAHPGLGGLLGREIDAARISGRTANAGDHHRDLHDLIDLCVKQLGGQLPRG